MNRGKKLFHKKNIDDFFESNSEEEDKDSFFDSDEDDFSDHFDDILMDDDFGFSNIGQIHDRLFNRIGMRFVLGDGNEGNRRGKGEKRLRKKRDFDEFISIKDDTPGTIISKSYCTRIDYSDGVPHTECYSSQSINQIKDDHKISEKQEAYKNSRTGVEKAARQRIIDDKGVKQIRQRNINTNTQGEHNIFKGLKEEDLDDFNRNYNSIRNKYKFQKNNNYLTDNDKKKSSNGKYNSKMIYPQLDDGNNKENNKKRAYKKHHLK